MGWNYLSIHKLQRLHRWSLGMDKQFHPILYNGCDYLSMLKLNHVGERGPCCRSFKRVPQIYMAGFFEIFGMWLRYTFMQNVRKSRLLKEEHFNFDISTSTAVDVNNLNQCMNEQLHSKDKYGMWLLIDAIISRLQFHLKNLDNKNSGWFDSWQILHKIQQICCRV